MELEILKLIPGGGSIAATVAIVILFLQYLARQDNRIVTALTEQGEREMTAAREYQVQLRQIHDGSVAAAKLHQEQVRELIDHYTAISRETVHAVSGLESTVRAVEMSVRELQVVIRAMRRDDYRSAHPAEEAA